MRYSMALRPTSPPDRSILSHVLSLRTTEVADDIQMFVEQVQVKSRRRMCAVTSIAAGEHSDALEV